MTTSLDLCRSVPFTQIRADGDGAGDGRTLEGYAAVFGQRAEIDSWEGTFFETVRKGAFRKTIRERTPVMQFDHGRHPLIGSIPIGRIDDLREDDEGLFVSARVTDNWLIQPIRDAIAEGQIDGMSFRFEVVREEWRDGKGKVIPASELMELLWSPGDRGPLERELIEVKTPELGPVVFPAYRGTTVGVRDAARILDDKDLIREYREALAKNQQPGDIPDGEVACALLFPIQTSAPQEERSEDAAPPEPGHPAPDAPPDAGHPSPTTRQDRERYVRLAYVTREGVGRRFK